MQFKHFLTKSINFQALSTWEASLHPSFHLDIFMPPPPQTNTHQNKVTILHMGQPAITHKGISYKQMKVSMFQKVERLSIQFSFLKACLMKREST